MRRRVKEATMRFWRVPRKKGTTPARKTMPSQFFWSYSSRFKSFVQTKKSNMSQGKPIQVASLTVWVNDVWATEARDTPFWGSSRRLAEANTHVETARGILIFFVPKSSSFPFRKYGRNTGEHEAGKHCRRRRRAMRTKSRVEVFVRRRRG